MALTANLVRFLLTLGLLSVFANGQGIFGPMDQGQLERLLSDKSFVLQQIKCVLAKAQCDKTGKQLKVAIPEVLVRHCRSCSPKQAENARKVMSYIQYNYPQEWAEIVATYVGRYNKKIR